MVCRRAAADRGASLGRDDRLDPRGDRRPVRQVGPAEDDARIGLGRLEADRHVAAVEETDSAHFRRVGEGGAGHYAPGSFASFVFRGYGYIWCSVETPPDKIAGFFTNVSRITTDMRTNGITADELLRAKTPIVERLKKAQLSNEYWLQELAGSQGDPRKLDRLRSGLTRYEGISADDINRAAHGQGGKVLENVKASMAPGPGVPLLGQSFLRRFGAWSIDNGRQMLVLTQSRR